MKWPASLLQQAEGSDVFVSGMMQGKSVACIIAEVIQQCSPNSDGPAEKVICI